MSTPRTLLVPVLLLALAACQTTTSTTREMEQIFVAQRDARSHLEGEPDLERDARDEEERRERVMELLETGKLKNGLELYQAAFVLVTSGHQEQLVLARDLAFAAADRGVTEALPVAAEAIDKELLLRGVPQRYGTQYVYQPVLSRWELYVTDTSVTDEERQAMGVPTLAEAMERLERMNPARASAGGG